LPTTTRSSPPPDPQPHIDRVRELTRRYKLGDKQSPEAFRELATFLLRLTVAKRDHPGLWLARGAGPAATTKATLQAATEPGVPVPLNDGRFLRLHFFLERMHTPDGVRLKVHESSFQYQVDQEGERWIVRYDYLREPGPDPHPQAHLQIRGTLTETGVPVRRELLEHVHFPTGRVPLEGVIRLLADQFSVSCNTVPTLWRPVLAESERAFQEIAHRPLSGPGS
jgi:hypothetical protein